MTTSEDKLWKKVSEALRHALGLGPLTREEAEHEYSQASGPELEGDEIERIVRFATRTGASRQEQVSACRPSWESRDASALEEGVLQLNRNAGDISDEVREKIEKHRREALGDDRRDDENEA